MSISYVERNQVLLIRMFFYNLITDEDITKRSFGFWHSSANTSKILWKNNKCVTENKKLML